MMSGERHRYLVAYDVRDKRRLRLTHKAMLGVGDPLQYSVFLCDLSRVEFHQLEERLQSLIAGEEDRVLVADLGPLDHRGQLRRGLKFLGDAPVLRGREALVF